MSSLTDYVKNKERVLLQTKIDSDLHAMIDDYRHELGLSWREFLEACFERIIEEEIENTSKRKKRA